MDNIKSNFMKFGGKGGSGGDSSPMSLGIINVPKESFTSTPPTTNFVEFKEGTSGGPGGGHDDTDPTIDSLDASALLFASPGKERQQSPVKSTVTVTMNNNNHNRSSNPLKTTMASSEPKPSSSSRMGRWEHAGSSGRRPRSRSRSRSASGRSLSGRSVRSKRHINRNSKLNVIEMGVTDEMKGVEYGIVAGGHISSKIKHLVRDARLNPLEEREVISSYFQFVVESGQFSYRALLCMSGVLMLVASSLDYFEPFQKFGYGKDLPNLIALWLLGFLIIQLEGRPYYMQIGPLYKLITLLFPFLQISWTKGIIYFMIGMFQFYQYTMLNMICSVFVIILSVLSMWLDYVATSILSSMRLSIKSEADITYLYKGFNKEYDGFLTRFEFKRMLLALGEYDADYNIFVAVLAIVDVNNNQRVTYDDLLNWYESFDADEMRIIRSCCQDTTNMKSLRRGEIV